MVNATCNGKFGTMGATGKAYHVTWCDAHKTAPAVPAAVTNIREALGVDENGEIEIPDTIRELLELAREIGGEIAPADVVPEQEPEVLPEVHDPAGDVLPFHVAAGSAVQVLGTRPIDEGRYPNTSDPFATDIRKRALRAEHSQARITKVREILGKCDELNKYAASLGAHVTGISMSR
mgnify:CR=1 FL=1